MSKTVEKLDTMGEQSLQWLEDFTKQGIDFVQQQAPDLCREIVNLGLWQWGFLAVMWLCIFGILFFLARKVHKWVAPEFNSPYHSGEPQAISAISHVFACSPLIGMVVCLYNFLSIYAAPKIYLLNYFASLYRYMKG